MEQHPIPQNVTTFQFRLIGDMTIKQFGYLAVGGILGYIFFKLPLPVIISWPLAALWVLLGIGLAFVPIEERPMDVWILSFIKSIYSPTQFVWQKSKPDTILPTKTIIQPQSTVPLAPSIPPAIAEVHTQPTTTEPASPIITETIPAKQPETPQSAPIPTFAPPQSIPTPITTPLQESYHPTAQPLPLPSGFTGAPPQPAPIYNEQQITAKTPVKPWEILFDFLRAMFKPSPPKRSSEPFTDTISLTGKRLEIPEKQTVQQQVPQVVPTIQPNESPKATPPAPPEPKFVPVTPPAAPPPPPQNFEAPKAQTDSVAFREKMARELAAIRQRAQGKDQKGEGSKLVATDSTPTVRIVTPESASKSGLPKLTTFPNVVTGIIKDSDGNLLPGVLVTIRDKSGMPVRALKSNKLGQIAASTPLPNGTYTVEVEDPRGRFVFDRAQITISGAVMPPIEILAKSQKEVMRSKLEKEIFGKQMT